MFPCRGVPMPPIAVLPAQLTLTLFGPFRLSNREQDITLRGRKSCALLAYLALSLGHRATREQVADLLWTDRGPDQARASLRQTLAELRAIDGIANALAIDRLVIALCEGGFISDLAQIMAAGAGGDLVALAQAVAPVEGDLLETFGDVSPRFDEWLAIERPARLAQLVAQCLACLDQAGMTHPDEAQLVLRKLDRLDPLNEGVARMGMRLDHEAGDSAALHRRYRRLVDQMLEEFGAPPAEATRTLFQRLTRTRAAGEEPIPSELPHSSPAAASGADELVPTVIVAPLQLLGDARLSPAQAEFCSDDMRVAISAMGGVRVLAADAKDVPALVAGSADALALYLLSGKVRDPGSGAVATLQLADARNHTILWSANLSLNDADDPLEAIVAKAVGALQPAIDRDLEETMRAVAPEQIDARALYTRARLLIRSAVDLADTLAGVDALERVVERNPRHLGAHLLLARMYNSDFWHQMTGHDVRALRERGAHHLEIAAALAPDRVDVRVRRAWVLLRQGAYDSAAKDIDAVLARRQLDPDILNQCAFGFCFLGDLDRAQALMQQAFELNPFAPSDYHADYATITALMGRAEEAEDHFLVSGETGLLYDAVRIANFAALAVSPPKAGEVQARFARKFAAAWQASGSPRAQDVIEWIGTALPLRVQNHRDFVVRGLDQRIPAFWPPS